MYCLTCKPDRKLIPARWDHRLTHRLLNNVIIKNCNGYSCFSCGYFIPKALKEGTREAKDNFYQSIAAYILCQPFALTPKQRDFLCEAVNLQPIHIGYLAHIDDMNNLPSPSTTLNLIRSGFYLINTSDQLTFAMEGLFRFKILQKLMSEEKEPEWYIPLYQEILEALDIAMICPQQENFEVRIDFTNCENLEFVILEQATI